MSLFERLNCYLSKKILVTTETTELSVKMEQIEDREDVLFDSDHEEGPSWRGSTSNEASETMISKSAKRLKSEEKVLKGAEDIHPPLKTSTMKEESPEDCNNIDDYVYEKISFVDFSDDEEDNPSLSSPQVPPQEVKREILSSTETSNSGITKQVVHSPEICRGETFGRVEAELSMPRVPVTTIKLEEREIKREPIENVWEMPRVKEEMDLDYMRSFSQEMSLCPENTGLTQSFKSLNTSGPLQDLENFTFTDGNGISIHRNERNSSDEGESAGENRLETFLEIDDLISEIEETENLEEIVSMLDSTSFFNGNNEFPEVDKSLFNERTNIEGMIGNNEEINSEENITDYSQPPELVAAVDTEESSPSSSERRRGVIQSTPDADDPFMDIGTQSQVLDFDEEYTDDESEDKSYSTSIQLSDQYSEEVEDDEEPELMDISSRTSSFEDRMAEVENSQENLISGDISEDDEIIGDDGIESLEGNNCRRENSTERMEISTGGMSEEMNDDKSPEIIENSSRSSMEEEDGETSGDIGNAGEKSEETVGDDKSVDESSENDDVLSLTTTMSDEFPDVDLDISDTSDDDLDEATPIAESTGINITDWIHEGQKRRLEGSEDDFGVVRAAKVQRLEGTMEDDDFSSKINPIESINLAAKESSSIIPNLMSIDRSNTPCKLAPNTREDDAPLYEREAEPLDASIPHERSLHRADTLGLGMMLDIRESETSSGVSPRAASTSSTLPLSSGSETNSQGSKSRNKNHNDSTSDKEMTSTSSDDDECTVHTLKTPGISPKITVNHDKVNAKRKFRKNSFKRKSKSPVVSSPASLSSPESAETPQNSLRKTPKTPAELSKPKNPPKKNSNDIQKKRKSSLKLSSSSEEDNSRKISKKPTTLRKKRKLYSRTDSIEDLTHLRNDLDENSPNKSPGSTNSSPDRLKKTQSPVERPEMLKKARIIPVEYYKTPKTVVLTPRVNNPVAESSSKDESPKNPPVMYSEFDFLTQRDDLPLNPTETSSRGSNPSPGTLDPSIAPKNDSKDSKKMQKSRNGSPETEKSSKAREKSPESSNSPEDTIEFIDLEPEDLDNSPEMTQESLEDDEDPMELPPTQDSHWTPSACLRKSSKSPEKIVSIDSSEIPSRGEKELRRFPGSSEVTQSLFMSRKTVMESESELQGQSRGTSEPQGDGKLMESSCNLPESAGSSSEETLTHPEVFQNDEMSGILSVESVKERLKIPILIELSDDEEEMSEASAPGASTPSKSSPGLTPEEKMILPIKSSSSQISSPLEHEEDQESGEFDPVLEILQTMKPPETNPVPVYTLTDDEEETEGGVDPRQVRNPSGVPVNPVQVSNGSEVPVNALGTSNLSDVSIVPLEDLNSSQVAENSSPVSISSQVPDNSPQVSNNSQVLINLPSEVPIVSVQVSDPSQVSVELPQVSNTSKVLVNMSPEVSIAPQVPINLPQVSNKCKVPVNSSPKVQIVSIQVADPSQVSNTSEVANNLSPKVPIPHELSSNPPQVSIDPHQVSNPPQVSLNLPQVTPPPEVSTHLPQVSNPPQENLSTDKESQHLTHISQLRKSPPFPPKNPSEPQPGTSKERSTSPTDMGPLIVHPTNDPKGWITEDDYDSADQVPEKVPEINSSKSETPASNQINPQSSDDSASDSDSSSTTSESSAAPESLQSEDSDYQSLEDGPSNPSIPQKPKVQEKKSKVQEKKPKIKKDSKPKIKPEKTKPNYLKHPLPKSKNNAPAGEKTQEESVKTLEAINEIHSQLQSKPPPETRMKTPKNMQVKLLDHQKYALPWMLWRESCKPAGGILADDMGLGKTVTTIALIMKSLELERKQKKSFGGSYRRGGTLIVCPAHLISQWQQEIESKGFIPRVRSYHKEKEKNINVLSNLAVVITSYETLTNDFKTKEKILFKIHWTRVVLDEAHYIRNSGTVKSEVVNELETDKRWALTGTPIHNEVKDIFAILRFLELEPFHELKHFNKWMGNRDEAGTARLHCVIKAVMLRRSKRGLVAEGKMPQLPVKTDRIIQISLGEDERLVYERVMVLSRTLFLQFLHQRREKEKEKVAGGDYLWSKDVTGVTLTKRQKEFLKRRGAVSQHRILTLILRLRQSCCHPSLIHDLLDKEDFEAAGVDDPKEKDLQEANKSVLEDLEDLEADDDDGVIGVDERIIQGRVPTKENPVFNENTASSKMNQMLEEVKIIIKKKEKIVIVSDWVKYLEMIGDHLQRIPETRGRIGFYTGKQTSEKRKANVCALNEKKKKMMILLLSLKAGGQGLNLMAANHVMIMDVHWNPQLEVQAEDRVYRIGQKKNVFIHRFIVEDTIEERIVQLQKRKLKMAEAVLSGSCQDDINNLHLKEMCSLFNL